MPKTSNAQPPGKRAKSSSSTAAGKRGGGQAAQQQPKALDALDAGPSSAREPVSLAGGAHAGGANFDEDEAPVNSEASPSSEGRADGAGVAADDEFEMEAAIEVEPEEGAAPRKAPGRDFEEGGGDSMLARYFREMATHAVMGPDEELQTAIEVEHGEIEHWVAVFSHVPAGDFLVEQLERDLPTGDEAIATPQLPDIHALLKTFKKNKHKATPDQKKKWKSLTSDLARAIRLADSDRLWIAHCEELAKRDPGGGPTRLRAMDKDQRGLALTGASEALRELFFANMSERAAKILREDMEAMGPVRLKDVDIAQVAVVTLAKDLAARGEILLAGAGGEDELVY